MPAQRSSSLAAQPSQALESVHQGVPRIENAEQPRALLPEARGLL
jgi:hypothetical protein